MAASLRVVFCLSVFVILVACRKDRKTVVDYLNMCFDAPFHKDRPSPEPVLFEECHRWSPRACCAFNSSKKAQEKQVSDLFNWNHCPNHPLSTQCRRRFARDSCFFRCSPNIGPWIIPKPDTRFGELIYQAPLCQSECLSWWEDCKNDYTCTDNWEMNFNWTSGMNTCPVGKPCRPFTQVYQNATNFCEIIWNNFWKMVPDSTGHCFILNFTSSNPNDALAKWKANQLVGGGNVVYPSTVLVMVVLILLLSVIQ